MFRLAHLSDLHVGPLATPSLAQLASKRLSGYINWHRKRKKIHDMAVLSRVIDDIRAEAPDHVACTGDLSNIGLPDEFLVAARFLNALGNAAHVSLIPGNHDAYMPDSEPAMQLLLGANMRGDDGESFPYLRQRDGVALIGMCSGVVNRPFMATGRVGQRQAGALEALLLRTAAEGLVRVVMIHHPPHRRGAKPGRRLTDAALMEAALARAGAELVIHGHNHVQSLAWLPGPHKPVPVVGVASASAVPGSPGHQAAWHLYEMERLGITAKGAEVKITATIRGRRADGSVGLLSRQLLAAP
jgi:3',5'-cyclic AMP phosphodiesterase CpdA